MNKETSRRQFIKWASAGVLGAVSSGPQATLASEILDTTYVRPTFPEVEVSYPSTWYLFTPLVTDLIHPTELFSLCSQSVPTHASDGESGKPDMSLVPDNAVLLTLYAEPVHPGDNHDPGIPIVATAGESGRLLLPIEPSTPTILYETLQVRGDPPPGFDWRTGWFVNTPNEVGYWVSLWLGLSGADIGTAQAVVQSIKLA